VTHCKIDAAGGTLQNYKSINNVQLANDSWNKYVLVIRRNVSKESEFRISGGRLFQARRCDRERSVAKCGRRRVDGSCNVRLSAERRRQRAATLVDDDDDFTGFQVLCWSDVGLTNLAILMHVFI